MAAGAHTFVQFACVQCHGFQGRGGVDPAVPALKTVGQSLTVAQLTHIINHGLGESADPKQPYMPVWGEVISKTQVSDLVAYIRAGLPPVADTSRSRSRRDREPRSPAPRSTSATAASTATARTASAACRTRFAGQDDPAALGPGASAATSTTDKAIAAVIRSGSVIGKAPIVSMPHWGGILSDQQIAELNAYLKTLK